MKRLPFRTPKVGQLVLIGIGLVVTVLTLAITLAHSVGSALYVMGGVLILLSIPMLVMTMVLKSLVLRSASFTSGRWQAYDTKSAELELTSSDLGFTAKCKLHLYIFCARAGSAAFCVGGAMLGATYLLNQT